MLNTLKTKWRTNILYPLGAGVGTLLGILSGGIALVQYDENKTAEEILARVAKEHPELLNPSYELPHASRVSLASQDKPHSIESSKPILKANDNKPYHNAKFASASLSFDNMTTARLIKDGETLSGIVSDYYNVHGAELYRMVEEIRLYNNIQDANKIRAGALLHLLKPDSPVFAKNNGSSEEISANLEGRVGDVNGNDIAASSESENRMASVNQMLGKYVGAVNVNVSDLLIESTNYSQNKGEVSLEGLKKVLPGISKSDAYSAMDVARLDLDLMVKYSLGYVESRPQLQKDTVMTYLGGNTNHEAVDTMAQKYNLSIKEHNFYTVADSLGEKMGLNKGDVRKTKMSAGQLTDLLGTENTKRMQTNTSQPAPAY